MTSAERLAMGFHEAGHLRVARALGLGVRGCEIGESGGVTHLRGVSRSLEDRRAYLATLYGGPLAERLRFGYMVLERGHKRDNATAARLLEGFPAADRARERSAAIDNALRALRSRWDLVDAIAHRLAQAGRWPA